MATFRQYITEQMRLAICIGCGSDDQDACWDDECDRPCHWLRVDRDAGVGVRSSCPELAIAWDAGDREIRVRVE
jgi:hypothetical protein